MPLKLSEKVVEKLFINLMKNDGYRQNIEVIHKLALSSKECLEIFLKIVATLNSVHFYESYWIVSLENWAFHVNPDSAADCVMFLLAKNASILELTMHFPFCKNQSFAKGFAKNSSLRNIGFNADVDNLHNLGIIKDTNISNNSEKLSEQLSKLGIDVDAKLLGFDAKFWSCIFKVLNDNKLVPGVIKFIPGYNYIEFNNVVHAHTNEGLIPRLAFLSNIRFYDALRSETMIPNLTIFLQTLGKVFPALDVVDFQNEENYVDILALDTNRQVQPKPMEIKTKIMKISKELEDYVGRIRVHACYSACYMRRLADINDQLFEGYIRELRDLLADLNYSSHDSTRFFIGDVLITDNVDFSVELQIMSQYGMVRPIENTWTAISLLEGA
uniref:Uncharacterized protein n=1 Tax=Panagrolaimus sp. JU765 TaxID=591449 RepID=A0AC34QU86_9BILA